MFPLCQEFSLNITNKWVSVMLSELLDFVISKIIARLLQMKILRQSCQCDSLAQAYADPIGEVQQFNQSIVFCNMKAGLSFLSFLCIEGYFTTWYRVD